MCPMTYGPRRYQSGWPTCLGHTRGITAASGSLTHREITSDEEPECSACHRGPGEFSCAECNALLCFSDAQWHNELRRYFCAKHLPCADGSTEIEEGAAAA